MSSLQFNRRAGKKGKERHLSGSCILCSPSHTCSATKKRSWTNVKKKKKKITHTLLWWTAELMLKVKHAQMQDKIVRELTERLPTVRNVEWTSLEGSMAVLKNQRTPWLTDENAHFPPNLSPADHSSFSPSLLFCFFPLPHAEKGQTVMTARGRALHI